MITHRGAAPPPHGRPGGVRARAVSIGPPFLAPENSLLQRVRGNRLLDQIRHSDSQQQVRRVTRLVGDLAAITSTLTMSLCDLLFRLSTGWAPESTWATTGGSGLARAHWNPELTGCFGTI